MLYEVTYDELKSFVKTPKRPFELTTGMLYGIFDDVDKIKESIKLSMKKHEDNFYKLSKVYTITDINGLCGVKWTETGEYEIRKYLVRIKPCKINTNHYLG